MKLYTTSKYRNNEISFKKNECTIKLSFMQLLNI